MFPGGANSPQQLPPVGPSQAGPPQASPFSPSGMPDLMGGFQKVMEGAQQIVRANPELGPFVAQFLTQLQVAIPQVAAAGQMLDPTQGGMQPMGAQMGQPGMGAPQQMGVPPTPMPL